ncbi:hypothetical protein FXO38_04855 [Capsicum annuum]|nr:hypothetical protein FXO38_04855 [Capsicum annuum]KAF3677877.1 hypothetical protein FXO37_04651 [Capsicum annuum]
MSTQIQPCLTAVTIVTDGLKRLYNEKLKPVKLTYRLILHLRLWCTHRTRANNRLSYYGYDERSIPGNTIVVQANFSITDLTKFDDSAVGNFPLKELKKLMPTKGVIGCIRNVSLIDDASYVWRLCQIRFINQEVLSKMESISEDTIIADRKQIPVNKFLPTLRSGECSDIGGHRDMEDTHICIADIAKNFGHIIRGEESISFYGDLTLGPAVDGAAPSLTRGRGFDPGYGENSVGSAATLMGPAMRDPD